MGVIVDTSVLIGAERGSFDFEAFAEAQGDADIGIAAITASELLYGLERTTDAPRRDHRAREIERVFDSLQVVPFGLAEARVHARLWADLAGRGKPIGDHDLLIAATAVAAGASVATLNQKEFKRVRGLALEPVAKFVRK